MNCLFHILKIKPKEIFHQDLVNFLLYIIKGVLITKFYLDFIKSIQSFHFIIRMFLRIHIKFYQGSITN